MNSHWKRYIGLCAICLAGTAAAYERATHAAITYNAVQLSGLNFANGNLLQNLGLDVQTQLIDVGTFGSDYLDIVTLPSPQFPVGASSSLLLFGFYEMEVMHRAQVPINFDLPFWLMCGVVREDDVPGDPSAPDANADGSFYRVYNHFYDPIHNVPLSGSALTPLMEASNLLDHLGYNPPFKAPDWAIGATNSLANPLVQNTASPNHFTAYNAREAMFRALTQQTQSNGVITDLVDESQTTTYDAEYLNSLKLSRDTYWATTFRALGDVLHLNQDMAQPQHTRNEPHTGRFGSIAQNTVSGHESVYEKYIDARTTAQTTFTLQYENNTTVQLGTDIPLALNYDVPVYPLPPAFPVPASGFFPNLAGFWTQGGDGLADYSNAGFFTAGNNATSTNYTSPRLSGTTPQTVSPTAWNGNPLIGPPLTVFKGTVPESPWDQLPDATGVPLTTYSVWDQFMQAQSAAPTYSLNRVNYDAMADLLVPRAAAYSAGLINFFFRGQMAISLPHEGVYSILDQARVYGPNMTSNPNDRTQGFNVIKLDLANTTPSGEAMSGGTLTAVLKFRRNLSFVDTLAQEPGAPSGSGIVGLTAVQGRVEEVIVSTATKDVNGNLLGTVAVPIPNAASGTTPIELEFDFNRALPLGSTDVSLQVVYRGALGNEPDAVVVATSYISEPTYFTYFNAFDYIRLGTQVYTRDQINGNPALLAQVRPTSCVNQDPPQLLPGCFPANTTLSVTLDANNTGLAQPLVLAANIPVQNYIRLAILTDGSANGGQSVLQQVAVSADAGQCLPTTAFTIGALNNGIFSEIAPATATTPASASLIAYIDDLSTQRGLLGWYITSCVYNGDGVVPTPTTPPDNRATAMAPLTGSAIYPYQTAVTFPQPPL